MNNKVLKAGFTLIEVLMVILIIALLMAFIVPQVLNGRAKANDAIRINHLKQLSVAVSSLISDTRQIPASGCIEPSSTLGSTLISEGLIGDSKTFPSDPGTISTCGQGGYLGERFTDGGVQKYKLKAKMETKASANDSTGTFYEEIVQ